MLWVQTARGHHIGLISVDKVQVILTSSETCITGSTATSNEITTRVNPMETPSVSITSNDADNNICQGTSVTFTAAPINGGNSPSYQWKVNGSNVGSNSANFTTSSLTNRDQVEVVITSHVSCLTTTTATSNSITNMLYSSLRSHRTCHCGANRGLPYQWHCNLFRFNRSKCPDLQLDHAFWI